jgi:hypothetical protein
VSKAEVAERLRDPRKVALIDGQVEVEMISRLFADQRIDEPAAVDPRVDVVLLKRVQHLDDVFTSHALDLSGVTRRDRFSSLRRSTNDALEADVVGLCCLLNEPVEAHHVGGIERFVEILAGGVAERGHEVDVVCSGTGRRRGTRSSAAVAKAL